MVQVLRIGAAIVGLTALLVGAGGVARADYALHDNDTVVFLGDSNTAGSIFVKTVENYTLLRYPNRHVHVINAGIGGDTAAGGLARLQRDVFDRGATVLIVTFGINDICWGLCAGQAELQAHYDAIINIVLQAVNHNVRVFINSYPVTGGDPFPPSVLQTMGDTDRAIAQFLGQGQIDVYGVTRGIWQQIWTYNQSLTDPSQKVLMHNSDGIHLNDLGHRAVGYAIVKGLGAPADVSSVTVNASGPSLVSASGATVTNLAGDAAQLTFKRTDDGLPINFGLFAVFGPLRWIQWLDQVDRYMLTVQGLTANANYLVEVDGRSLGSFPAAQLAAGVNLTWRTASGWEPGGPWDAQSTILASLTDARRSVETALGLAKGWIANNPNLATLDAQAAFTNALLELMQHTLVAPTAYNYVIRRVN